jgi:hypothetical protein
MLKEQFRSDASVGERVEGFGRKETKSKCLETPMHAECSWGRDAHPYAAKTPNTSTTDMDDMQFGEGKELQRGTASVATYPHPTPMTPHRLSMFALTANQPC